MQITHEEAHRLIQVKADHSLTPANEETLRAHLMNCAKCRDYLNAIREMETTLRITLHKEWDIRPLPLHMDVIYAKVNSNSGAGILMTTRTALIGIAFVMFAFITWQSMNSSTPSLQTPFSTVPMIPTPSISFTGTNTLSNECRELSYIIQDGDTIESIAADFSVSKESIIAANNLTSDSLRPAEELIIPFCELTPTSTTHPPTFTITPNFETISTTPG